MCRFCRYRASPPYAVSRVCTRPRTCIAKALKAVMNKMIQPGKIHRILLTLVLGFTSALSAYGRPSSSLRSLTGQTEETMSFLAWVVLGLIAGFIGSKIVNRRGEGILLDILLGVVGALAGGWLFHIFGAPGVSGLNFYSLFVAVIGSVVLLVLYHAAFRRRRAW